MSSDIALRRQIAEIIHDGYVGYSPDVMHLPEPLRYREYRVGLVDAKLSYNEMFSNYIEYTINILRRQCGSIIDWVWEWISDGVVRINIYSTDNADAISICCLGLFRGYVQNQHATYKQKI